MDAVRCPDCGDVRWSYSGFGPSVTCPCKACGTVMVPERRVPLHVVAAGQATGAASAEGVAPGTLPPAA